MARKPEHDSRGEQKGAQQHAEGQLGEKAYEHLLEQRRTGEADKEMDAGAGGADHRTEVHHIHRDTAQQNDPAERASLRNQQDQHPREDQIEGRGER